MGRCLQQFHGDVGTGFGIGEGVVVVFQIEAAGFGHGMQLVVGQLVAEVPPRCAAGATEPIAGILHLVGLENRFQTALVERTIVCHEGQSGHQRFHLPPHFRKRGGVVGVFGPQTVHFLAEPRVVVRYGMNEAVEGVGDDAVAHHHHADAAHAAALSVGGLEINGCEVFHNSWLVAGISVGKGTSFSVAKLVCGYDKTRHSRDVACTV